MGWSSRHLLGIESLVHEEILLLLQRAEQNLAWVRASHPKQPLSGRVVANLFFEPSTRTRFSFELAAKKLGAEVLNVAAATTSTVKGETALDTLRNLEAMHVGLFVVRHASSGMPHFLAERTQASVVNAGDGLHEHPTQALGDALVMIRHKGALSGLKVALCGDILHSRVARSHAWLLGREGAEVRLCGPRTLLPHNIDAFGGRVHLVPRLEEAVEGADVVMMLRLQEERFQAGGLPSRGEYSRTFGLRPSLLARAKPDALVMHPGPINLGVEMPPAIAQGGQSVVLEQVEAGVAMRMAVLELLTEASAQAL